MSWVVAVSVLVSETGPEWRRHAQDNRSDRCRPVVLLYGDRSRAWRGRAAWSRPSSHDTRATTARPATLREEIRIRTFDFAQVRTFDSAQRPPSDTKSWMERHPVWFGLIVGAGVGAGLGAASCGDGCFPIGASGAALVGSWYGAGAGALIGWGIGRAK